MVQILPRIPTGRERFMQGLGQAASSLSKGFGDAFAQSEQAKYTKRLNKQKDDQIIAAGKKHGFDWEGVPDEMRQEQFKQKLLSDQQQVKFDQDKVLQDQKSMDEFNKAQELQYQKHQQDMELKGLEDTKAQKKAQQELNDKVRPLKQGLDTLKEMRKLRKAENIGKQKGYTGIFSPATQKDRAQWITYGNSLIPLASSMPIRNQAEFEAMVGKLNDPDITLAEMDGVLDSMEHLLKTSIKGYAQGTIEDVPQGTMGTRENLPNIMKERPPLTSFVK